MLILLSKFSGSEGISLWSSCPRNMYTSKRNEHKRHLAVETVRTYGKKTCWSGAHINCVGLLQPILDNAIANSCGRGAAHQSVSDRRVHYNVVFFDKKDHYIPSGDIGGTFPRRWGLFEVRLSNLGTIP